MAAKGLPLKVSRKSSTCWSVRSLTRAMQRCGVASLPASDYQDVVASHLRMRIWLIESAAGSTKSRKSATLSTDGIASTATISPSSSLPPLSPLAVLVDGANGSAGALGASDSR